MRRPLAFPVALGIALAALALGGCSLFPDLADLSSGGDGGPSYDAGNASDAGDAGDSGNAGDAGDAGGDCGCTNLVSAYRFSVPGNLGHDFLGNNDMTTVTGKPTQSTSVPSGFSGYSIQLDGSSNVCIESGFTFDSSADHTLCWWSRPDVLGDQTNQFAQSCGYDTWTANSGADYLWRINNCNGGVPANLQVPNVYTAGNWTQICQTYSRASLKRTVVVNGNTSAKVSVTDTAPIVTSGSHWCIGSYGSGGFWTGLIYQPMWFDRVLSDAEIQQVSAHGCCLP